MRERESAIHNQTALCPSRDAISRPPTGLVEMDERRGVGDEEGLEAEVLEDDLVGGALDGVGVEEGFDEEEGRGGGVEVGEEVGAEEEVMPDVTLEVGVDEVTAVEGAADGGGGEVGGGGEELVGDEPFLVGCGGGGAGEAVGDDGEGIEIAGEAGFDETGAIVEDDDGGGGRRGHFQIRVCSRCRDVDFGVGL